ncbi:MAG TPA: polyprenyl diphosphate synthase [Burkholderiaceae bacterium]|nr:polyprenyl diphosphate synthase [Burkholderiaceae bacterium]
MRDIPSRPQHIAIVMDGNGRWAKRRLLPRVAGHKQGVEALQKCVKACMQRDVKVLTVFAFSSENWERPEEEVSGLMELLAKALAKEVSQLAKEGVRLHFVGDREHLSDNIKNGFDEAEQLTNSNTKLIFNICFNYGGRWDIAQAAAKLAAKKLDITPSNINAEMSLSHVADPDLIIRTGGEQRLSNFLLWQAAYSELYFCDTLWPDFDENALDLAIESFHQRERRFGKTSEQVLAGSHSQQ